MLIVRTKMVEKQSATGFLTQKSSGHPQLKGHKLLERSHPAVSRLLQGTLTETRARRVAHILMPWSSFKCQVTGDDPWGCRAGLTGFEVATCKLSGLTSICWVWLVEATFIFVSVRSAWFYLTFSQEHHVIAVMLLACCTRSCSPSNKAMNKKRKKLLNHSPIVANVADFQRFKYNTLVTWLAAAQPIQTFAV